MEKKRKESKLHPTSLTDRAIFPFSCFLLVPTTHSYLDSPKEEFYKSLIKVTQAVMS